MADDSLYDRIVSFLKKETMVRNVNFNRYTQIERDLGVTGDDAAELIEAFAQEFRVDLTHFTFHDYFGPEGTDVFCDFPDSKSRKKLNIADLEEAVKQHKLL